MEFILENFNDPFEKELEINIRECAIEIDKLEKEYLQESKLDDLYFSLYVESDEKSQEAANEQKKNIFCRFFSGIIEAIRNLLSSFRSFIENTFSPNKEDITTQDFLDSQTGKVKLDKDIEAINKQIDEEILKGRKIIQKISQKYDVSDKMIADFIDGGAKILDNNSEVIVNTSLTAGLLMGSIKKKEKEMGELAALEKKIEKKNFSLNATEMEKIRAIMKHLYGLCNDSIAITKNSLKVLKNKK